MDILAPFFAASGLQPHDADAGPSSGPAAPLHLPPDRIAAARVEFPSLAIAIDDASTTDVDDAISYTPPPSPSAPSTLHVHVADVDRLLDSPAASPLFSLLEQRASSAYFPGQHIPLLPHPLCLLSSLLPVSSSHPAPLQPNPCITISFSVDSSGSISSVAVAPHFLPKLVRLTYDVVDRANCTSESSPTFRELWQPSAPPLLAMPSDPRKGFVYDNQHALSFQQLQAPAAAADSALTSQLRNTLMTLSCVAARMRGCRAALPPGETDEDADFYSEFRYPPPPSASAPLDVAGRMSSSTTNHPPPPQLAPSAAAPPPPSPRRLNARHTVAEFMIAACTAAAAWCSQRSIAVHYRSQPSPNLALTPLQRHASLAFASVAEASRASFAASLPPLFPSAQLLSVFAGKMATVAGMQAAVTDVDARKHHGIGAPAYMQCTSPIRRFSDLLAQRQMKAALGFGEAVASERVLASLARQSAVRAGIKRAERLLERRAVLSILRSRHAATDDPSKLVYHCVVLKALPPGKGSPGGFGDFPADVDLLPPPLAAELLRTAALEPTARGAWFAVLIPALGVLERCLLPHGTPLGAFIRARAVAGNAFYGRIRIVRV